MKSIRSILPLYSLALVFGFLTFTAACATLSEAHETSKAQSSGAKLALHAPLETTSAFARQASDGELETSDENPRQGGRIFMMTGILFQSKTLSVQTVLREQQLPRIPIRSGSRSILFSRLII